MLLHAFGIFCGLSAVVFATLATRRMAAAAFIAAFVIASLTLSAVRFPDPSWVAVAAALAAGAALWRPCMSVVAAGCGGAVAAVWALLLEAQGLPAWGAYAMVAVFAGGSAVFAARRPSFAPAELREEALMIVAVFAVILAAAPPILEGFDSAVALTAVRLPSDSSPSAPWALLLAAACLVVGGVYSLWKQR